MAGPMRRRIYMSGPRVRRRDDVDDGLRRPHVDFSPDCPCPPPSPRSPRPTSPRCPRSPACKLATAAAGIRYKGRTDVLLAVMDKGTTVAGVFTKSKCPSAPVEWCRAKLEAAARRRALVVNSGNANAFTGKTGRAGDRADRRRSRPRRSAAAPDEIFLASTGVIGEPLDATKFDGVLGTLAEQAAPGRLDGRRQGDHDHRHLPEGRDRDRQARQGQGHHQRHGQGRRHDRARHGDHAVVRLHRRADRGGRAAGAAARAASKTPSMPSPSTATPRPRTRCWCSPPARPPRTARRKSAAPAIRG